MSNRRFELLKDTPDAPAGTVFKAVGAYNEIYAMDEEPAARYLAKYVEDNPEWFRELPQRIEFDPPILGNPEMGGGWLLRLRGDRPRLFVHKVKADMELVLNGGFTDVQLSKIRRRFKEWATNRFMGMFDIATKLQLDVVIEEFVDELILNKNK